MICCELLWKYEPMCCWCSTYIMSVFLLGKSYKCFSSFRPNTLALIINAFSVHKMSFSTFSLQMHFWFQWKAAFSFRNVCLLSHILFVALCKHKAIFMILLDDVGAYAYYYCYDGWSKNIFNKANNELIRRIDLNPVEIRPNPWKTLTEVEKC